MPSTSADGAGPATTVGTPGQHRAFSNPKQLYRADVPAARPVKKARKANREGKVAPAPKQLTKTASGPASTRKHAAGPASDGAVPSAGYPFPVDPGDHCETPLEAYQDIGPVLETLCSRLRKTKAELRIYDPYFCLGAMRAHLKTLGFLNVYNKKEDFYLKLAGNNLPPHDVLLTNPPYSKDHVSRILRHAASSAVPALLLVPAYVYGNFDGCGPFSASISQPTCHPTRAAVHAPPRPH